MPIIVQFGQDTAILKQGRWRCDNKSLEDLLNAVFPELNPDPAHYWPELRAAELSAERFGGVIVKATGRGKDPPGVVYGPDRE